MGNVQHIVPEMRELTITEAAKIPTAIRRGKRKLHELRDMGIGPHVVYQHLGHVALTVFTPSMQTQLRTPCEQYSLLYKRLSHER